MGVVCSTTNKKNKQRKETQDIDGVKLNNKADKINSEKIINETNNNLINNVTKNSNKISCLKEYKFYLETYEKNDYFIVSNFEELKFSVTIDRLYKKWEEIMLFTRKQKKFSYRNLNQNYNFTISNANQRKTSYRNNKEITINNNNLNNDKKEENCFHNQNNHLNLNNTDDPNLLNFNYTKDDLANLTLGRGSLIENYIGRNSDCSNLIQKFQIAFYFNKYRYIKYLSKGPPNNLRWNIWVALALCQSNHDFISEQKYLEIIKKDDKNFVAFEEEQIKKDLNRSNENKEFFCNKSSLDSLYNILKALAIEDPELGYCQGMNILAANFLMISDGNEYETFNMLRFIFKHMELREFFLHGFPKLIMYLFILKEFIRENLPKLFEKISELEIPEETWIFKWLQTLYNLTLPLSISIRLIDCLLCFGLEFLLNFSLAFIKCFEKKLLLCEDINDFLNTFKFEEIINPNILVNNVVSSNSNLNKNETNEVQINNDFKNNNKDIEKDSPLKKVNINVNNINIGNEISITSPNKTANQKKVKKEENSCFNFVTPKKENKEYANDNSNNIRTPEVKSDSNNIANSDINENLKSIKNLNQNNDDKKSSISTSNNNNPQNQIKYKINTQDELLSFREKLITNAKKIDLKEAIKQMIDNYTKENMDSKNKFNDNESSTGDGLNEDKSHVYDNENLNLNIKNNEKNNKNTYVNNDISNLNSYNQSVPFKISYRNSEKSEDEIKEKIDILKEIESSDSVSIRKHLRKSKEQVFIDEIISEEKDDGDDFNAYFHDSKSPVIADKFNSNSKQATKEKSENNSFKKTNLEPFNNSKESCKKKPLSFKNFPFTTKNNSTKKSEFTNNSNNKTNNHEQPFSFKNNKNEINNFNNNNEIADLRSNNNNNNNNFSYRYKNFFSINFDNNNNQTSEFHRFSLKSIKEHSFTPRGLSIAQISLMNNIQEKLDIIKKIDCLENENENENENEESNLDINYNIDENFDSDAEWENRSKINRNINVTKTNVKRMSDCFSPDKFAQIKNENSPKKKKIYLNAPATKIINSAENDSMKNLEIESDLYLEEASLGGSLYENYSDCEFFETGNKEEHFKIKVNKTNPNTHIKEKTVNGYLLDRSNKKYNKINSTEENPNKILNVNSFLNLNNLQSNLNKEKKHSLHELSFNNHINKIKSNDLAGEFIKSIEIKRKEIKSFVNDSDEKKLILNNLGIEVKNFGKRLTMDSNENKNFLHIKADGSNKSLVKVNCSENNSNVNRNNL